MASRVFYQFQGSLQRKVVSLYAKIPIGSSGAVGTLDPTLNKGILSVVHNGAGLYTITFGDISNASIDKYSNLLALSGVEVLAAGAQAIVSVQVAADNSPTGSIQIATLSATATNANPDASSILLLRIDLKNI